MAKILKQVQDDMVGGDMEKHDMAGVRGARLGVTGGGKKRGQRGGGTLQKENSRLATGEGMKVQALAMTQVLVLY